MEGKIGNFGAGQKNFLGLQRFSYKQDFVDNTCSTVNPLQNRCLTTGTKSRIMNGISSTTILSINSCLKGNSTPGQKSSIFEAGGRFPYKQGIIDREVDKEFTGLKIETFLSDSESLIFWIGGHQDS